MKFYLLGQASNPRYSGTHDYGHKWGLPGIHCPVCGLTGATTANFFPSVDLSHLPVQEQKKYRPRVEEDFAEFERLCEQVRPLVPPEVQLLPGTGFGPMDGSARGEFGPLTLAEPWSLIVKPEPLARLQAEGLRGLKGCRTELRFRKKNPPELLEMELTQRGHLHEDCLPEHPAPCPKCQRVSLTLPAQPILDEASLPQDLDVFRLAGFRTLILGTERFVEVVRRLGFDEDIAFRELPVRGLSAPSQ